MKLRISLKTIGLALLLGCLAFDSRAAELITANPRYPGDFTIVSKEIAPDNPSARYEMISKFGIFSFDINLTGEKFSTVTLTVKNQQSCEGLNFQPRDSKWIDLKGKKGVKIETGTNGVLIEFSQPALAILEQGGRVQFINQYR